MRTLRGGSAISCRAAARIAVAGQQSESDARRAGRASVHAMTNLPEPAIDPDTQGSIPARGSTQLLVATGRQPGIRPCGPLLSLWPDLQWREGC
jgi:hypothetical protein